MLDLIITNGTIVDGTGQARRQGDVGLQGDRIVEVGKVTTAARRTIDAAGRLVTPGFVDIHTHFDGQVSWDSQLAPSCVNGVTSVVMGNCGVGFAPVRPDRHEWLIDLLEGVEDIPGTALAEGLTWDWETFPEYLDALDRRRFSMDVGAQLPHAALRAYVMGDRGREHDKHPDDGEIARMQAMTREALAAGAIGFSTSRSMAHISRDGRNIGTLRAQDPELCGIARAIGESGRGVIQLISDAYQSEDEAFAEAELAQIRRMAELSGRPLSFSVMQANNVPTRWRRLLDAAGEMVRDGLVVRTQVAPRPIGTVQSLASTVNLFMGTPTYRSLASLPLEERVEQLRESAVKARIVAEYSSQNLATFKNLNVSAVNPWRLDRLFRMSDPVDYEPSPEVSLEAEARKAGRDPIEYVYDVLLERSGRQSVFVPLVNYADGNLDAVHAMLTSPTALFGLSDAGAHVATICDGAFPTTTLSLWGRGGAGRDIPIETLVNGYSRRNAVHVGWHDRGVVAPGYLADLNIIDLERLSVAPPEVVADLPAGGSRFHQKVRGYDYTIKRGSVTMVDGKATGETPGRLVRGRRAAPSPSAPD
jgi:N-acyl-D-aspartate/D-glutamate deacylase